MSEKEIETPMSFLTPEEDELRILGRLASDSILPRHSGKLNPHSRGIGEEMSDEEISKIAQEILEKVVDTPAHREWQKWLLCRLITHGLVSFEESEAKAIELGLTDE